jgi:hypothetical protein
MGTFTAPRLRMAMSTTDQSGRFSDRSATRSPFRTPSAESPSATARTRWMIASPGMWSHSPDFFRLSASAFACRASASRHIPGTLAGICVCCVSVIRFVSRKP